MPRPTTIILFGITGDLSSKKLLPAMYDMYKRGELDNTCIVGFSRRPYAPEDIRTFVKELLPDATDAFLGIISYVSGDFDDADAYSKLSWYLSEVTDKELGDCSNKLFYLATPPNMYEMICTNISASGLSIPCGGADGFARILIEKPFGKDLQTAIELDELLGKLFKEEQIYRIDHYLAKESLLDILKVHRVSEEHGERWNGDHIEKIEIDIFETAVVGSRGASYDGVGALRDVGQNHMLQMLALVAMDLPSSDNASDIQMKRAAVLESIHPAGPSDFEKMKFGQYAGYLAEPGVDPESKTETMFSVTLSLDKEGFRGVSFTLRFGKALAEKKSQITIYFKDGSHHAIPVPSEDSGRAYQKILRDCIVGDQTVFISTREIMAEWAYITPILRARQTLPLAHYNKGISSAELFQQALYGFIEP